MDEAAALDSSRWNAARDMAEEGREKRRMMLVAYNVLRCVSVKCKKEADAHCLIHDPIVDGWSG